MRLKELWLGLLTPVAAFTPASTEQTDRLAAIASSNVLQLQSSPGQYHKYEPRHYGRPFPSLRLPSHGERKCTPQKVQVRREWDSFSCDEKEAYISAVKCLMSKPSQSNYFAPGSRNRWDDFSAVHINQTGSIHGTVSPFITAQSTSLTHTSPGQLPPLAPLLHLALRARPAQRMQLPRLPTLPQLAPLRPRPAQRPRLRRQSLFHRRQRRLRPHQQRHQRPQQRGPQHRPPTRRGRRLHHHRPLRQHYHPSRPRHARAEQRASKPAAERPRLQPTLHPSRHLLHSSEKVLKR